MFSTTVPLDPGVRQGYHAEHITQGGSNVGVQGFPAPIQADIKYVLSFDARPSSNCSVALLYERQLTIRIDMSLRRGDTG